MTHTVHVAVLGAGPGGYAAAFAAADLGMSVALVDEAPNPGGVCLYRGCIPSKALLHVARVLDEAQHAKAWGVDFGAPTIDLGRLREFKNSIVAKLTGGLGQLAKQRKVTYVQGRATIVDARTLGVATKEGDVRVEAEHIVLATGSRPTQVPSLSLASPRVMDSSGALELAAIPKTLLIVGGGYIGLELGTVYAALGAQVTVVEMTDGLLPGVDRDLVSLLARRIEKQFTGGVLLNTRVATMVEAKGGVRVTFEGADVKAAERVFEQVLVSIGRRPNSNIPGLERTKVVVGEKGFIETDGQRRTAEPTIFAIGEGAGEPMLAHKASHEARTAIEAIAGHKAVFEPLAIPAVVFTDPEIAWAGLTETQAKAEGLDVEITRFPWAALGRAVTLDRTDGLTKLVLDRKSGRIFGVGLAGVGAGELVAEGVLAIEMGATAEDLKLAIHPHPTLSETLMESAEIFFGTATHVYRPKRK